MFFDVSTLLLHNKEYIMELKAHNYMRRAKEKNYEHEQ